MSVVKVLIVDDSPVIREKVSKMLSEDPEIKVLGIADGKDSAMEKIADLKPDVITLNLKSRQNSNTFLKEVSTKSPLPVVVITETAIESSNAIKAGAVDFVKIPLIRTASTMESFVKRLVQQIKIASKTNVKAEVTSNTAPPKPIAVEFPIKIKEQPPAPRANAMAMPAVKEKAAEPPMTKAAAAPTVDAVPKPKPEPIPERTAVAKPEHDIRTHAHPDTEHAAVEARADGTPTARALAATASAMQKLSNPINITPKGRRHVIALGASTGGTDALQTVLQDLPVGTPGIVIVQHMPEMFTKMYADRLDRSCKMKCVEAVDGERVEVGKIILAAGNFHMRLARDNKGYYVTSQHGEKVSGHCPSVDVLFESVAKVAGKDAIGAILTGMGADGAIGLKKMRDAGAFTIGQDQNSCVVYGMPMVAYNMGAVCLQAPLGKIPQIILENC